MIKFHAKRDGVHVLGLGLSRANCERLLAGKPILIKLDDMRKLGAAIPWEGEIVLLAGETEASITDDMMKIGALDHTRVSGDIDKIFE